MRAPSESTWAGILASWVKRTCGPGIGLGGVAVALAPDHRWQIGVSAVFVYAAVVAVCVLADIRRKKGSSVTVKAFPNWRQPPVPQRYSVRALLRRVGPGDHIEIAARTCFRWLCGTEELWRTNSVEYDRQRAQLWSEIVDAFRRNRGLLITILLQCPKTSMPWWNGDPDKIKLNERQFRLAVDGFIGIREQLGVDRPRFRLAIVDVAISNSMTRITSPAHSGSGAAEDSAGSEAGGQGNDPNRGGRTVLLIVDLSDPVFLSEKDERSHRLRKPFVVFETKTGDIPEYRTMLSTLYRRGANCSQCREQACPARGVELLAHG